MQERYLHLHGFGNNLTTDTRCELELYGAAVDTYSNANQFESKVQWLYAKY